MHKSIKPFDLDIDTDFEAYLRIWRSGTSRRPHDHPQYMRLMKTSKQHPCALVYFEDNLAKIIYPFYLINLSEIEQLSFIGGESKHMISAYGYGGPALLHNTEVDFNAFEKLLDDYIKESNIISEFVREDLFAEFKVPRKFDSNKQQDNVVVNLNKKSEELIQNYKHSVRKNIKRAESANLHVLFDFSGKTTKDFVEIYHATMSRTNASQSFMISLERFENINPYLIEDKIGFYAHVLLDDKVIATELILRSPGSLYSFLGGSNMEYSNLRPSDLLKHKVNTWAIENKISRYVLGGGVRPNDGIYTFKLAFDPEGSRPFFIQRNIHNSTTYDEMVSARSLAEQNRTPSWKPNTDFFPAYLA
ncbi:FemAB family protein [compost metagenome]